jgi:predicted nucleic acid-binding protein
MILVDTGAWLALADRGDAYHAHCREFFRRIRRIGTATLVED